MISGKGLFCSAIHIFQQIINTPTKVVGQGAILLDMLDLLLGERRLLAVGVLLSDVGISHEKVNGHLKYIGKPYQRMQSPAA